MKQRQLTLVESKRQPFWLRKVSYTGQARTYDLLAEGSYLNHYATQHCNTIAKNFAYLKIVWNL